MQHQDSRIYQRALELVDLARLVIDAMPSGFGFLVDQLRRAAASVPLNFAEGSAKRSAADRQRFFQIAKGSAYEVAAVLDVAHCFGVIDDQLRSRGLDLCDHIGAMLGRYR